MNKDKLCKNIDIGRVKRKREEKVFCKIFGHAKARDAKLVSRCKFHQRFTRAFFVASHFGSFSLFMFGFVTFGAIILY